MKIVSVLTLGGGPAVELASELDTDDLGGLQLPGEVGHDIDSVSTADTDGGHTETTTVGGVRVSADEKTTGESVVLEEDLVDDTGAGLPETDVVLGAGGGKEVVDLLVDVDGTVKILGATDLGLDQMVTVDGGRVSDGGHAGGHELEDGHLGGGVLASYAVRAQLEVGNTALELLLVGVVQMGVENLLGVRQGLVKASADDGEVLGHLLVVDEVALLPVVLLDLSKVSARIVSRGILVRPSVTCARACGRNGQTGQQRAERTLRSRGESETVAMRRMPRAETRVRAMEPRTCLLLEASMMAAGCVSREERGV